MFCDAAVPQLMQHPQSGTFRIGRSYSSSASTLQKARTGFLVGSTQNKIPGGDSIQSRIGAIFGQGLPLGLTGVFRETPGLVLTVDGNSAKVDRNIISIVQPSKVSEATPVISFKVQLETVQEKLGLSITQISQLFGVTRKSVYDWLDGAEPRINIANRMESISSIIDNNSSRYNLKRLKGVWLTAVSGRSFIDILADDSLDEATRLTIASAKLEELAPRLGQENAKTGKTYLGNAHTSDIDRVADLG